MGLCVFASQIRRSAPVPTTGLNRSLRNSPPDCFLTFAPFRVRVPAHSSNKKTKHCRQSTVFCFLAESMGLEPTRLLHPTRFPGELLSHSVNPPYGQLLFLYSVQRHLIIYHKWTSNASKSFCFFEKSFWVVRKVQLNAFKYVMLCLKRWEQSERICIFGGAYFGEMGTFPVF